MASADSDGCSLLPNPCMHIRRFLISEKFLRNSLCHNTLRRELRPCLYASYASYARLMLGVPFVRRLVCSQCGTEMDFSRVGRSPLLQEGLAWLENSTYWPASPFA